MPKGFTLGLGCGIIALSAIIFFYYITQAVVVYENDTGLYVTDEYIIERASALGMVFNDVSVEYVYVTEEITDVEIIRRAFELGMDFPDDEGEDENGADEDGTDEGENGEIYETGENGVTETGNAEEDNGAEAAVAPAPVVIRRVHIEPGEGININIPSGTPAGVISNILYENKIIANAREFTAYVESRRAAERLLAGDHVFRLGLTHEEVLAILQGANRR